MIRILLSILLVIGLAAPAVAMPVCHDRGAMPQMAAHQDHGAHKAPEPEGSPRQHDCIGCAASLDLASARPAKVPTLTPMPRRCFFAARAVPGRETLPEPPPPRMTV